MKTLEMVGRFFLACSATAWAVTLYLREWQVHGKPKKPLVSFLFNFFCSFNDDFRVAVTKEIL